MSAYFKQLIALICCIFYLYTDAYAEGTKELMPNENNPTRLLFSTQTGRDPFGLNGGNADYRLFIHVADPANEVIYFGMGQLRNNNNNLQSGSLVYTIYKPDNTVLCTGNTPVTGENGYINTFAQAQAGPAIVNPAGYTPLFCDPTIPGDYYITFVVGTSTARTFDYFDISVVNVNAVPTIAKTGRVFSKNWQIRNPQNGFDWYTFEGNMFIYTNDGIVTKLNPNNMEGRDFSFSCNESGCYPIGPTINAQQARRSQPGPNPHTYPQYKIFVNNPDPNVYPDGVIGQLVEGSVTTETFCSSGTVNFNFQTTPFNAVGTVEVLLSLSTLTPPMVDRILITNNVPGGSYTVVWDGKDGTGNQVPSGSTFPFTLRYMNTNGLTNLPLWDVENNQNGFIINLIRPVTVPPLVDPAFYWDDMLVGGTQMLNPPGCTTPPSTSCHAWSSTWGDQKTINTWWYLYSNSAVTMNVTYKISPSSLIVVTSPTMVCQGETITIFLNPDPNTVLYNWQWEGGSQITSTPTVSINFPITVTPGTTSITVYGFNPDCGNGLVTTIPININSPPNIPTVSGPTSVCLNEGNNYTTCDGMTNYNWSILPNGTGLITAGAGTNSITVTWIHVGTHTLTVNYSNSNGCFATLPGNLTVTVSSVNPVILGSNSVCFNSLGNIYTTQSGMTKYIWIVTSGGTITAGGSKSDNFIEITWTTSGAKSVSVNFTDPNGCIAISPTIFPVTVHPLPTPTISTPSLMAESFENGGNIPAGWTIEPLAPGNSLSFVTSSIFPSNYNAYNGSYFVRFDSYDNDNGIIRLKRNIPISTLGLTLVNFAFAWLESNAVAVANDRMEVEWSTDGIIWNTFGSFSRYNVTQGWKVKNVVLPAATLNQPTVFIAFKFISNYGMDCYLDFVHLTTGTTVCPGSSIGYTTQPGMTNYNWSVSSGGIITSGAGTETIVVDWNTVGNQVISANYTNLYGCTAATPALLQVSVVSTIPVQNNVSNVLIGIGQERCYNAYQTIIVAGNGSVFEVQNGGSTTMIAGQNIKYLPATTVQSGGYMWGYIAPSGPWCQSPSMPAVPVVVDETPRSIVKTSFKVYPNPTTGNFILELTGESPFDKVQVDIYGVWGGKVMSAILNGNRKHEFSLSDRPAGVYFIRVVFGNKAETVKIIKQ